MLCQARSFAAWAWSRAPAAAPGIDRVQVGTGTGSTATVACSGHSDTAADRPDCSVKHLSLMFLIANENVSYR